MLRRPSALLLAATGLLQLAAVYSQSLPTAWTQGTLTFYGGAPDGMNPNDPSYGTLDGACGYGLLSQSVYPYWTVAALSTSNKYYLAGPNNGCGQCFEIQCVQNGGSNPGGCISEQSVTVTITDSCPQCSSDHIDMQALTFAKIANPGQGIVSMQYRRVDCTPPAPVTINVDNNVGAGGWLRMVVEKTAGFGGITAVSMQNSGSGNWMQMVNKFGSAWEVSNTPALPWDFTFTSDSGQTIMAPDLINSNGQVGAIPTAVQFALSGSSGSQSIAYDSQGASATPGSSNGTTPPPASAPPATAPPPPSSQNTSSSSGGCSCQDVTPAVAGGYLTCAQQKSYGKCTDSWMVDGRYCQATCGNCPSCGTAVPPSAAGAAITNAGPPSPSSGGSPPPSSGGSPPPPSSGSTPPPSSGGSPPPSSGGSSPPPSSSSTPPPTTGQGSVQTFSIDQTPPPPSTNCSCQDVSPGGQYTCAQQAQMGQCGEAFMFNGGPADGYCAASCYRCPTCSG